MDLYPNTIAYIKKSYSKESDHSKLIKKIANRFCITDRDARRWIEETVGVGLILNK